MIRGTKVGLQRVFVALLCRKLWTVTDGLSITRRRGIKREGKRESASEEIKVEM